MRFLSFLFLLAFVGVVVAFAVQNQQPVVLDFFNWQVTGSVALLIGVAYVLGMLSGWSIVGMLRRSIHRISEAPEDRRHYAGTYR
jgi:uncharacterized membrane protein YciS (DUF1049 family)